MKQLLSMSKQRKDVKKVNNIKQILGKSSPDSEQQDNFIYEESQHNNNEPSQNQIRVHAQILGIKLPQQEDLLYIARDCLNQPMPKEWRCEEDKLGEIIYVNDGTGQVSFEHPCDEIFRLKVINERKKKVQDIKKGIPKINIQKSKTSFVENVFKAKTEQQDKFSSNQISQQSSKQKNPKDLSIVINNNIKNGAFLYDDDYEPTNPIQLHKRSKYSQKNNVIKIDEYQPDPPSSSSQKQKQKIKQSPKVSARPKIFDKRSNPSLLLNKRQEVEDRLHHKYEQMNRQLEDKYISKLTQMKNKQNQYRNANDEEARQIIGEEKIQKRKKEIQMKLMLQHAKKVQKKRLEHQRQYQNDILALSSKFQIDQLFTEMAECRKFLNRKKDEKDNLHNLEEMERNIRLIGQLQTEKVVAEIQNQSRILMHDILNKMMKQKNDLANWERQAQIRQKFQEKLQKIIEKIKINNDIGTDLPQINIQNLNQIESQQKISRQGLEIFEELQRLKKKLKDLKEDNLTQRSNLSQKQSKLVDLLQNRAGSSSSRSQYR